MPRAVREPEVMTLQDALTLTLLDNPALSSWPWELRALDADTRQASRRPNPRAGALVENIRTEGIESTLQISQLVELGGKRSRRMALARAERAVANWAFESARADVVALTARLFVEALAAQERVAIQGELVRVAQETSAAVSTRVRAGGASYVEDTRAQLALEGARVELASAEREQAIAYRRLAAVWGNFKPQFSVLRGDLTSTPPPVPLDSLLARIDRNPDVARWAAEISRRESLRAAARASRVPDVDLDVGVRRLNATQETGLLLGIGVPIPVFDRVQDGATAAELRIQSASEQRRTSRAETVARLAVAYEDAAAGLDEYHRLQDDLLPKARSCHEATRSAYRSGLLRLTDVLDVQRTLFEVRLRAVDALVRYHTAAFEIERLTGMPVAASNTKEPE
jgi:cobalt-zinc-cadmium efflux system outer membrane protein